MQLSRRRFLALSATVVVGACSGDDVAFDPDDSAPTPTGDGSASTVAGSTSSTAADTSTTTTTTTTTTDPPVETAPGALLDADPFAFGVASGDPDESSVVLWTRLGRDLPVDEVALEWELTTDDGTTESGSVTVDASTGFSAHVVARASGPGEFVFRAGEWTSPTGRTAPIDPTTSELRIATASCQNYEAGFYAAHRDIAEWSPDLVLFLGDFVYENAAREVGDGVVRTHEGPEPTDLDGYRTRYATYLSDPDLQACRAAAPWMAIWDDHEVDNDYAGLVSQDGDDPDEFARRRAMAYRAWWENTPTRLDPPDPAAGSDVAYEIHRGVDVGDLVRISLLDGRQHRSDQLSDATLDPAPPPPGWDDPERTMLGGAQEGWIAQRFSTSGATWNCLAQQTVLSDARLGEAVLNYDQWDGYVPARQRMLADAPANLVTLTGDIHLAGVGLVGPIDGPVGVEFITTAISSSANVPADLAPLLDSLPAILHSELVSRGYTRHVVTPESWTAQYRQVVDVLDPASEVVTWKTFRVDAGTTAVTTV
ncbi:alkaline phosphatase D family protein [Ilumatobacter sp.]|uniref:alkaline phosphatase D family protein n=1 Tax=Ilumatobacter sp. TaxID=1967498 RepID=UPI003B5220A2